MGQIWVLLNYKVPPEPSARRVYVWRKLKKLGAYLLHDSVWVLPLTEQTREQFQWLGVEIGEMEGEAFVWEAHQILNVGEERLIRWFTEQTETGYQEILAELELAQPNSDLATLARRYQQIKAQDYFHSELGQEVYSALLKARGDGTE
jgi:hypothetical protein